MVTTIIACDRAVYVCICNAVSENDIRQAVREGVREFETLRMHTGCSTCCGCCEPLARTILADAVQTAAAERNPETPPAGLGTSVPLAVSR